MFSSGGGGFGDGDLMRILKDEKERPSGGAIFNMCRRLGMEKNDRRTINKDDAWEYFYELLSETVKVMSREELYNALASYLSRQEVDKHLTHIESQHRKTA